MVISFDERSDRFELTTEENEKILNIKYEGEITRFRIKQNEDTREVHLNNQTGEILPLYERQQRLPPERIVRIPDEKYYFKEIYYIDENQLSERIRLELYEGANNNLIGKSYSDKYTLFQNLNTDYEKEKESILNRLNPARYFRSRGYHTLSLERKVGFWYLELLRMERFNSPYELPYKNILINLINEYYIDKVMLKIDKSYTNEIICRLAKECGLDESVAIELLINRNDKNEFNKILDKHQLK